MIFIQNKYILPDHSFDVEQFPGDPSANSFFEVLACVKQKDYDYVKPSFEGKPSSYSLTFSIQLIHMLSENIPKSVRDSAIFFISQIGGAYKLLQQLKYGFIQKKYLKATVEAILVLKCKEITPITIDEETDLQMEVFNRTGDLRISLFDFEQWIGKIDSSFFIGRGELESKIHEDDFRTGQFVRKLIQKENRSLMKKIRTFESFCHVSPPWAEIRNHMMPSTPKLLISLDSVKTYLSIISDIILFYNYRVENAESRLNIISSRQQDNFRKLELAKPILRSYHDLKNHAIKPDYPIWMWGWSSIDQWYYKGSPEIDIVLLRLRFELWRKIPNHHLSLSPDDYEKTALDLIKDDSIGDTFRSKIYYDLFMFIDVQLGRDSIYFFTKCVDLTASYANRHQLYLRINSMLEGCFRQKNRKMYENCLHYLEGKYEYDLIDKLLISTSFD